MSAPRVALLVETSREYGRGILRGITRYQKEHEPWSVYFRPHGLGDPPPPWLASWKGDGILARIDTPEMADAILRAKVPAIDLRISIQNLGIPVVGINNISVIRLAIEHFIERGHYHFAFYGSRLGDHYYNDQRARLFSEEVKQRGYQCNTYDHPGSENTWEQEQGNLMTWLHSLPKPIAVMTCHDDRGQQLMDACLRAGIRVPEELAVLGVDNDPFLCDLASPPLSSIDVNCESIGYTAAQQLDAMMRGKSAPETPILIEPRGVVIRQSSDILAISDPHVLQAMRQLRDYACTGQSVEELFRKIPISRSALFRRFKKFLGYSPKEEVTRIRLERAKQLLRDTQLPVTEISERTGYAESKYFIEVFNQTEKTTPLRYRRQFGNCGNG